MIIIIGLRLFPPLFDHVPNSVYVCVLSLSDAQNLLYCAPWAFFFSRENKRTFLRAERRAVRFWRVHLGWLRGTRHFCTVPLFCLFLYSRCLRCLWKFGTLHYRPFRGSCTDHNMGCHANNVRLTH